MRRRAPIQRMALAAVALTLLAGPAGAQGFRWPEKAENLQVLPATTSADELSAIMRGFTGALGIRCSHCHVGEEGQPLSEYDFPSDDNPKKRIAREMLRMVARINESLDATFNGTNSIEVTCQTCHRGNHWPITIEQELDAALESGDARDAVTTYRELRDAYYGGFAYDFSERTLDRYARGLLEAGKNEAALELLRLNTEYFPQSSNAFLSLGAAYQRLGESDLARIHIQKAVLLDPVNRRALRALQELSAN